MIAGKPQTLLLVEDDDAVADTIRLHLELAGYAVRRESDGGRAMLALQRHRWDLVLLDLMLPGADGWDICRQSRARHDHVPIIMISARAAEAHRVLGLELGADDYLVKPFSMLELVARVRALTRRVNQLRAVPPPSEVIMFGHHVLDPVRRELRRRGPDGVETTLALTPREFDLLHFLAQHGGTVFSRAALLQRVWGSGFDGYEHTVNSHINRLRAKIEADPQDPALIQTVWGVGYRFNTGATAGMA